MKKKDILKNAIIKNIADRDTVLNYVSDEKDSFTGDIIDIKEFDSEIQPVLPKRKRRIGYILVNSVLAAAMLIGGIFVGYDVYKKNSSEFMSDEIRTLYNDIEAAQKRTIQIKSGCINYEEYIIDHNEYGSLEKQNNVTILFDDSNYDYDVVQTSCDGVDISRDKTSTDNYGFRKLSGTLYQMGTFDGEIRWEKVTLLENPQQEYRHLIDGMVTIEFLFSRVKLQSNEIISIDVETSGNKIIYTIIANRADIKDGKDIVVYTVNSEGIVENITADFAPYYAPDYQYRIPLEMIVIPNYEYNKHTLSASIEERDVTIEIPIQ